MSEFEKNIILLSIAVFSGGMSALLFFFFRKKLRKIEDDFWAKASEDAAKALMSRKNKNEQ